MKKDVGNGQEGKKEDRYCRGGKCIGQMCHGKSENRHLHVGRRRSPAAVGPPYPSPGMRTRRASRRHKPSRSRLCAQMGNRHALVVGVCCLCDLVIELCLGWGVEADLYHEVMKTCLHDSDAGCGYTPGIQLQYYTVP